MVNDIIKGISDSAVAISAIIVAAVSIKGLSIWRNELTGKAIFEAGKSMMGAAYRVVDSYQMAVSLMTYPMESVDRPKLPNETDAVKSILDEGFARGKRLELLWKNYSNLAESNWEVRAMLSPESAKKIENTLIAIKKEIIELTVTVNLYFNFERQEIEAGIPQRDQDSMVKMHSTIYQSPDSEHIKTLNSLISDLDKTLKPYIRINK